MKAKKEKDLSFKSSPDYVPMKEKIAYGCGALMDGGGVALMACVMLKYMTDTLGIVAASASTIMMVSKIWDAVTDPLMGSITDNTRTKWGRRRPFMVFGGVFLIIALALLFAPIKDWWGITSQAGMISYVLIFYIVWNTCSTITQVPYTSMASDISPSFRERNNANTIKLVFTAIASGLAYVLPLLILGAREKGTISGTTFWIIMVAVFGTMFGGGLIITGLFTKERVKPEKAEKKKFNFKQFLKGYIQPYKNKSYAWHIGMYVSAFACMDMLSALAAYYASHVWRGVKMTLPIVGEMTFSSMFIIAPIMVAAVLAFPLVRVVMDKKGKAFAFRMGLPFYILGGILIAVLNPQMGCPPWVIPIVAFLMGFGFGGAQMIPWMNFPDTLDVAELTLGERPTGNYSGMMTLVRKIGGAFGVGTIGWVLTGVGYEGYNAATTAADALAQEDPASAFALEYVKTDSTKIAGFLKDNQAVVSNKLNELAANGKISFDTSGFSVASVADNVNKVLLTIRLLMGISIAVLIAFALFSSFRFHLNNKILARMRYFSEKIKNGEYDELTDEEKQERIDLIKKHYGKYDKEEDEARIAEITAAAKAENKAAEGENE
ncbi:MAG: MFS transporter [Clostridia bacterium]|nr:MFS transporter [Clostridia bacterium]